MKWFNSRDNFTHGMQQLKKTAARIQHPGQSGKTGYVLKRYVDFLLAGIGLISSAWLWVVICIAIIAEDGFPVLIRQCRIGKDGKFFFSVKFRSMLKITLNEKINYQACENDPRVTKVGRILRNCALDELPQLLNIFAGDMSFVGPRALLNDEIEINDNSKLAGIAEVTGYEKRITVRPGLTGIAQIFAPRDIPRRHKFKYDLLYIRKMSFQYDLVLILLSFLISLNCTWEKRSAKLSILDRK